MEAVDLLHKRDWKVTARKREGWRKEIGVVMAKKRAEAPQNKSTCMCDNLFRNTEVRIKY
jgi:hypothetical protein